jgi:hypothetical protein
MNNKQSINEQSINIQSINKQLKNTMRKQKLKITKANSGQYFKESVLNLAY